MEDDTEIARAHAYPTSHEINVLREHYSDHLLSWQRLKTNMAGSSISKRDPIWRQDMPTLAQISRLDIRPVFPVLDNQKWGHIFQRAQLYKGLSGHSWSAFQTTQHSTCTQSTELFQKPTPKRSPCTKVTLARSSGQRTLVSCVDKVGQMRKH